MALSIARNLCQRGCSVQFRSSRDRILSVDLDTRLAQLHGYFILLDRNRCRQLLLLQDATIKIMFFVVETGKGLVNL